MRERILAAITADPEYTALTISPDGRCCAWVGRHDDAMALVTQELAADGTPRGNPTVIHAGADLRGYAFLHDDESVFLLLDATGDECTRAMLLPRTSGAIHGPASGRLLTPEGVQCRLLAHNATAPHTVLIGLNQRDPEWHDVYRLDAGTGEITLLAENPGYGNWIIDHRGQIRGGLMTGEDASVTIQLAGFPGDDLASAHPAFTRTIPARLASGVAVLAIVPESGHDVLWLLEGRDPDSGTVTEIHLLTDGPRTGRVFNSPPGTEFDSAWVRPGDGSPQILEYGRWDIAHTEIDHRVADEIRRLRQGLTAAGLLKPGATVNVDRRDASGDRLWAVQVDNGATSPHSLIWHRATGHLHDLGPQRPEREQLPAVCTTNEEFCARDGRAIPGYLTVAEPGTIGRPCPPVPPLVVLVHGGPWERDRATFDAETTLLALSGYAVLRVNYRGSAGLGPEHLAAGNKQWGLKMSDDLDDAVRALISQNRVDPDRVAIMGASYGGYAALMAACRDGFGYRCAVAAMAPTDLRLLIDLIPDYWKPALALLTERIGNPETDAELLHAASPLHRLDRLHIPLLLAYGEHDPRVPGAHMDKLVAALTARGIDHQLLRFPDEGHALVHVANRLRYYRAALDFLDSHLMKGLCR